MLLIPHDNMYGWLLNQNSLHSLAKDGVKLLGDVVLLVAEVRLSQFDDDVGVCLAIDVGRVKVRRLG